jgi:MtaA/CmuA family methyltransferase
MMNGYERIFAMLQGQAVDRLPRMPITMMFAADQLGKPYGRYATDFRTMVEAQLLTAERFGFDYVSVISDPACEAADCGATAHFFDDQPPAIDETAALLIDKKRLATLKMPDPSRGRRMQNRIAAGALFHEKVGGQLAVEGWIEGPCAEAADLRGINRLMTDFFDDPAFIRDLFEFTLQLGLKFAKAQLAAGADLIGVGDAAASLVGPKLYEEFVLPYERRLIDGIHAQGGSVRMHICGNINRILAPVGSLKCEMVDIDSMVSLSAARAAMGPDHVLAGNISPVKVLRNGTAQTVAEAIHRCHAEAGERYIIAAGCEVPRDTPPENVLAMFI